MVDICQLPLVFANSGCSVIPSQLIQILRSASRLIPN